MKTAISLPDRIFDEAEQMARRLGITRSELYAKAVAAFLEAHRGQNVTEALDRVYAKQASRADAMLSEMQAASVLGDEW